MLVILLADELDHFLVDIVVGFGRHVIPRSPQKDNNAANILIGNAEARAVVEGKEQPGHQTNEMQQKELQLERQPCANVFVVDVVNTELRDGKQVAKTSIVSNKDKVLLFLRKQFNIFLPVFTVGAKELVPDGHEQGIVGTEVSMMAKMELRSVE
jgi:hypothetical protein